MKWKDSDDDTVISDERNDLSYDGNRFSMKKESDAGDLRPNLLKKNFTPLIAVVAGVFVVLGLAAFFLSGSSDKAASGLNQRLEKKIDQLEDRIAKLEFGVKKNAEGIKRGENLLQVKMKRLDRMETALNKKMNQLAGRVETRETALAAPKPQTAPPPKAAVVPKEKPKARYHTIRAGENLYRISLRYNIKLDELRRLNGLNENSIIQPGQKLLVRPSGR